MVLKVVSLGLEPEGKGPKREALNGASLFSKILKTVIFCPLLVCLKITNHNNKQIAKTIPDIHLCGFLIFQDNICFLGDFVSHYLVPAREREVKMKKKQKII